MCERPASDDLQCPTGSNCSEGACICTNSGLGLCNGACPDLKTDSQNCGKCDNKVLSSFSAHLNGQFLTICSAQLVHHALEVLAFASIVALAFAMALVLTSRLIVRIVENVTTRYFLLSLHT